MNITKAAQDVLTERERQQTVENWPFDHDDMHMRGELAKAAGCYAFSGGGNHIDTILWPWHPKWWKPTTPRRDLVKAGALILAEIERLDRLEAGKRLS